MDYETISMEKPVSELGVDTRATFITRTYAHLLGAITAFTVIEVFLFKSGIAGKIAGALSGMWLLVLGAFMVVGWLASRTAMTARSLSAQYMALTGYVVAEAIIFIPMLYLAQSFAPGVIQSAAAVTILGFCGLTMVVYFTRADFSFLRGILYWGGILALVAIVASLIFGFHMGTWFSVVMIGFAGAAILYDTSNIFYHFPEDRYVGASLELFASVALMFWYVLRLFIAMSGED